LGGLRINLVSWTAKILGAISQLLMIRYLIGLLGVDLYAVLAVINSFSIWLMMGDLGFGPALQNLYSQYRLNQVMRIQLYRAINRIQSLLLLVGVPLTLALSPIVGSYLFRPFELMQINFSLAFVLSNVAWILTAVGAIHYKLFYSEGQGHLSNIFPALGSLVSLLLVAQLGSFRLSLPDTFYAVVAFVCIPQLVAVLCGAIYFKFKNQPGVVLADSLDNDEVEERIRIRVVSVQAAQFFITSLLIQAVLNFDYIIMSQISKPVEIAQYKIVNSFYAFLYSLIYASLLIVWPFCSEALRQGRFAVVQLKLKRLIGMGGVSILVFLGLLEVFKERIGILVSEGQVSLPSGLIVALAFLYIARLIGDAYAVALASINQTRVFLTYLPVQFLLGLGFSVWLGLRFSVLGIVMGIFLSFCLTHTWVNVWYLRRLKRMNVISF